MSNIPASFEAYHRVPEMSCAEERELERREDARCAIDDGVATIVDMVTMAATLLRDSIDSKYRSGDSDTDKVCRECVEETLRECFGLYPCKED